MSLHISSIRESVWIVSRKTFSTFLNDDQICRTTAVLTVTDAAPGPCIALQGPVDSIEWLSYTAVWPRYLSENWMATAADHGPSVSRYGSDIPSEEKCHVLEPFGEGYI
ncbi:hypothetical protein FIBSPDRAFT_933097 [Athelia psychrophila]|uniref:Uncharacterized protein n=1 Tax=Athelia psychrophila TaxID=1759441 RepID=A0A166HNK0_9AGAM|nr:hypothetical protein FIBSPDRAFT_933097 [Fibularhizoctonia sp. CBS 109695]